MKIFKSIFGMLYVLSFLVCLVPSTPVEQKVIDQIIDTHAQEEMIDEIEEGTCEYPKHDDIWKDYEGNLNILKEDDVSVDPAYDSGDHGDY